MIELYTLLEDCSVKNVWGWEWRWEEQVEDYCIGPCKNDSRLNLGRKNGLKRNKPIYFGNKIDGNCWGTRSLHSFIHSFKKYLSASSGSSIVVGDGIEQYQRIIPTFIEPIV